MWKERQTTKDEPAAEPELERTAFLLDRERAVEAIARAWGLSVGEPASWRLDRFGVDLGESLEIVASTVFAPNRGLVSGPEAEVRVFSLADDHACPMLVCVVDDPEGPMLCTGIEDITGALPEPWAASPELLAETLQTLLDFASAAYRRSDEAPGLTKRLRRSRSATRAPDASAWVRA